MIKPRYWIALYREFFKGKTAKERLQLWPEPRCSKCFDLLKEGDALDCYYPYHVEHNLCWKCKESQ